MKKLLKIFLSGIIVQTTAFSLSAQKLPNKQTAGVRLPTASKIDGKMNEWNNKFHPFNHATEIYYTLANDDKNLYLAIQATNPSIIRKVISGGISFSVVSSTTNNTATITYPVFEMSGRPVLDFDKAFFEQVSTKKTMADSVVMLNNRRLEEKSKLIMVTGVKGIDSLISVYNENGIKVVQKFDSKMAYNLELAVPLAHLGLSMVNSLQFRYHIVLNGTSILPEKLSSKEAQLYFSTDNELIAAKLGMEAQSKAATDFFGDYILATK